MKAVNYQGPYKLKVEEVTKSIRCDCQGDYCWYLDSLTQLEQKPIVAWYEGRTAAEPGIAFGETYPAQCAADQGDYLFTLPELVSELSFFISMS
ncbi:hypothetical protein GJ744_009071 [Endocarpon pusillum]|uniref:Uncharacterized protein n=1 Tax=Endocarpon pusillum TaxID=364733 RepID=A0A8H7AIC4_9EURO|nr:hypothetical protein GJ744_009071 [Endocarpon pusillum]